MEVSVTNLVAADATTVTGSSQDATYVDDNIQSPDRPFYPWRTTAITAQNIVFDFGSPKPIRLVLLVNCNYTSARVQGNASDAWGAPSVDEAITIGQNPWTRRYQHALVLSGFDYRYMRLLINAQTPTDGAAYFSTGGLWAGTIATMPRDLRENVLYEKVEPRFEARPPHDGWMQRARRGNAYMRMTYALYSTADERAPGKADQLAQWLDIEDQMRSSEHFVVVPELGGDYSVMDTSQVYVTRRRNNVAWEPEGLGLYAAVWNLEESVR